LFGHGSGTGMLYWLSENKDALVAFGALVGPMAVLIGTVFVAPRVQARIAREISHYADFRRLRQIGF
jgi:hypothetical protein